MKWHCEYACGDGESQGATETVCSSSSRPSYCLNAGTLSTASCTAATVDTDHEGVSCHQRNADLSASLEDAVDMGYLSPYGYCGHIMT